MIEEKLFIVSQESKNITSIFAILLYLDDFLPKSYGAGEKHC